MTLTAGFAQIERRLRRLPGVVLDALLPPRCLACGGSVEQQGTLCADCWLGIEFLGPPCCACCGLPFEYDVDPDALCGACMAQPPAYERARAVMRYGDVSKRLLLSFKRCSFIHIICSQGSISQHRYCTGLNLKIASGNVIHLLFAILLDNTDWAGVKAGQQRRVAVADTDISQ